MTMVKKIDFSKIKEYYISLNNFTDQHVIFFDKIVSYYNENIESTTHKLKLLFDYYNYSNRFFFSDENEDVPRIKFVYNGSDFELTPFLLFKNGVCDVEERFSKIIKGPVFDKIELEFNSNESEDSFFELIWTLNFVVLHVWLSYIYINSNLNKCGLVISISDHQSSDFFYLNDLNWNNESVFSNEIGYPLLHLNQNNLDIFEIFKQVISNSNFEKTFS